ncbi:DUF3800 domain-containing protein [Sporolituus thermophilus]|uniref:DUF3800 domain-containing protein n=1 Tax=Sporolituus thermophilus DSM 23256 TaxID=1123285 RepID=A0A1G7HQQ0_9FIRM|nr:DUF3800 domain-containing protein [Sporolituus thermophilus]SDF02686.1 hypothetical protein SAMN05660235_00206 [Sporolituus thermophilus DSM 23256]
MYFLYVDESGDTGIVDSPTRYYVLAGLVVHELASALCTFWLPFYAFFTCQIHSGGRFFIEVIQVYIETKRGRLRAKSATSLNVGERYMFCKEVIWVGKAQRDIKASVFSDVGFSCR